MSPPRELHGLSVRLDKLVYQNVAESSPERPHCFVYFITIRNDSPLTVQILARKWVVKDEKGELTVVEGEGVVGQTPTLKTGEEFSYNSYHLMESGFAVAEGAYFGTDSAHQPVFTRIPKFELNVPDDE